MRFLLLIAYTLQAQCLTLLSIIVFQKLTEQAVPYFYNEKTDLNKLIITNLERAELQSSTGFSLYSDI